MESEDWNRRWASRRLPSEHDASSSLAAEVEGRSPGRALDLACGQGRNAVWLARRGWQVTAVDFSELALGRARALASRHAACVEWLLADLREYEPPEAAFDLVLYLFVHLPAPVRRLVLRRAAAALAPGGTLLIRGHDLANRTAGCGGPSDPSVLYTAAEVAGELPGLSIELAEQARRAAETADGSPAVAIDVVVRALAPANDGGHSRARER